jgi:hypothetical protein
MGVFDAAHSAARAPDDRRPEDDVMRLLQTDMAARLAPTDALRTM